MCLERVCINKVLRKGLETDMSKQQVSNLFNNQRWGIYLLSLPLKNLAVCVMERYKLTFTMMMDIPDPTTLDPMCKRIYCCGTITSQVSRIKPKHTTPEADTTIVTRYTLLKSISDYLVIQFEKIQTLLSCSHKT